MGNEVEPCLHLVASVGNMKCVDFLVKHGARTDVLHVLSLGNSPFMKAAAYGELEIVQLLLAISGVDLHSRHGEDGSTALMMASGDTAACLLKWPCSMAIIVFQELSIYYHLDASSNIDLLEYLGKEDDYIVQLEGGGDHNGANGGAEGEEENMEEEHDNNSFF